MIIFIAIVFASITIAMEIHHKSLNKEAKVTTWNYKLSILSRIIYIVAMSALLVLSFKALDKQNSIMHAIFAAIPSIFFFFVNIIAINQRNVNAALHFIALGGSTMGLLMCVVNMETPFYYKEWEYRVIIAMLTSAMTCCYAFIAWIMALSHRNDK